MKLICCKDENHWVDEINSEIKFWFEKHLPVLNGKTRLFLPAGETPRPLYKNWEAHHPDFLNHIEFLQLDEILTGKKRGEFKIFFIETLPSYQKQIRFISEAERAADYALLGLGVNGHVAFHEPGIAPHFYSGCLELNSETALRIKVEAQTKVVTYGVQAFMKSKAILMIVRGEAKKNILKKILNNEILVPASYLLKHEQITIITDFKV